MRQARGGIPEENQYIEDRLDQANIQTGGVVGFEGFDVMETIQPFIVRNWRRATKGSIRVSRKCAQWFCQRCQKDCDFRHW